MLEESSKFIPTTGIVNQAPKISEMLGCCSGQKKPKKLLEMRGDVDLNDYDST